MISQQEGHRPPSVVYKRVCHAVRVGAIWNYSTRSNTGKRTGYYFEAVGRIGSSRQCTEGRLLGYRCTGPGDLQHPEARESRHDAPQERNERHLIYHMEFSSEKDKAFIL